MTVAEATLIADNALEHTVRCLLAAMAASEVLKSTQGAHRLAAHARPCKQHLYWWLRMPCMHEKMLEKAESGKAQPQHQLF